MRPAAALTLTASAALLLAASRRTDVGGIEPADESVQAITGTFDPSAIVERVETFINVVTEAPAMIDTDTASANVRAFLTMLQQSEGTDRGGDAYRVCFGYTHTIADLSDHPAITGEWLGEALPSDMCIRAGYSSGVCKSTAAGAYQFIKPTWADLKRRLGLPDFGPASQDAAAVELVRKQGALSDVQSGRLPQAVNKCRSVWASLPGNYAGQGQRSMSDLSAWFQAAGGALA